MKLHSLAIGLSCLMLAACGGSGESISSGGTNAVPPPPPPPPTITKLVDAVSADTTFGVAGATSTDYWATSTLLGSGDIEIQYLAATDTYQLKIFGGSWGSLVPNDAAAPDAEIDFDFGTTTSYSARALESTGGTYNYSNLFDIHASNRLSFAAFGMSTSAANVPSSGTAHFDGQLAGTSNAYYEYWGLNPSPISGTIEFDIDFSTGLVGGAINPTVFNGWDEYDESIVYLLDPLVMSGSLGAGSNAFAGIFVTDLTGTAQWTGLLTGPNAQEAIGGFTFPFILPADGNQYQASGAWIAKQ